MAASKDKEELCEVDPTVRLSIVFSGNESASSQAKLYGQSITRVVNFPHIEVI